MRIISKARLKAFWGGPDHGDAEGPLRAWYTHISSKTVTWQCWGDVKEKLGNASLVGNCVVFNIGGNKVRLITRILYSSQKVFILKVITHEEYDKNRWKEECGCYEPQPTRKRATHKVTKRKRKGR